MQVIPYGKQSITQEDIESVVQVLQADFLTQGPKIKEFEEAFANWIGVDYAVAVCNGTAALHLSAMALDVGPSTKVITSPITFAASANCVKYCGGEVVFSDIDPATLLLDIEGVKSLLSSSPRDTYSGIIPIDLAGYPLDVEAFRKLADEYGLWIIEDACHAPGAYFTDSKGDQQRVGNGKFADLSIFSFHAVKHLTTGEGGMITTNDKKLYEKLIRLRTHGITKDKSQMEEYHGGWYYEMKDLGFNYRITDIQCALGISQLQRIGDNLERRMNIAAKYDRAFKYTSIVTISTPSHIKHAYHLYIIQVENRKELYERLKANNIFTQVHYIPTYQLPYYRQFGYRHLPHAEKYYSQCLSLPMYHSLTSTEQNYVIDKILEKI